MGALDRVFVFAAGRRFLQLVVSDAGLAHERVARKSSALGILQLRARSRLDVSVGQLVDRWVWQFRSAVVLAEALPERGEGRQVPSRSVAMRRPVRHVATARETSHKGRLGELPRSPSPPNSLHRGLLTILPLPGAEQPTVEEPTA